MFFRRGIMISLPIAAILLFPLFSGKSHAADPAVDSALEAAKSALGLTDEAPEKSGADLSGKAGTEEKAKSDSGLSCKAQADEKAKSDKAQPDEKASSDNGLSGDAPTDENGNNGAGSGQGADRENSSADNDSDSEGWEQANYAGVENRRILRGGNGEPHVSLWYPALGNKEVDASLKRFAEAEVKAYADEVSDASGEGEEKPSSYSMWDLSGIFFIERPSARVVSVTFNIYKYSGGAHGNISIDCLNYNLATGRQLGLSDLFRDPEKALRLMSALSAQKLLKSLGEEADEDMLAEGTAPLPENFNNLTLVPKGLFVEFQPYQVGPWSIGPQRVELSLEDLAPAGPSPEIWNTAVK